MRVTNLQILLVLFFMALHLPGNAQKFSSDFWHTGEVDESSGQTIRGKIKYDLDNNNIQLLANGVRKSLSPRKVDAFQFMDELTQRIRVFYALPFIDEELYEELHFFELLHEGSISLLSRERVVERVQNHYDPYWIGGRNIRVTVLDYQYYLMNGEGEIQFCESKLESALAFFGNKKETVRKYAKSKKLNVEEPADMISLVAYYNSLVKS